MAAKEVIIVGAGLFGSIAATLARAHGHHVTVIDARKPYSASKCSGCVLAPSWLSSLTQEQCERGLGVLSELYQVHDLTFHTPVGLKFKAQRVDTEAVLVTPDTVAAVESVGNGSVKLYNGAVLKGVVLVAAGIWSPELVEMPKMRPLYGASILYRGVRLPNPVISTYAPYRQAVAFQTSDQKDVWFGDGTALIQSTWLKPGEQERRIAMTQRRGQDLLKIVRPRYVTHVGARPYVEGHKAGYFARVSPRTWVSTGGAKNGTILAAAQAYQFVTEAL